MDKETRDKIIAVIERLNQENQSVAASRAYGKPLNFYWYKTVEEAVDVLIKENGGKR